jgi:hypothetical protein
MNRFLAFVVLAVLWWASMFVAPIAPQIQSAHAQSQNRPIYDQGPQRADIQALTRALEEHSRELKSNTDALEDLTKALEDSR